MSYNNGSIVSATPAQALVDAIETELTAHPNWELADTHVISSNSYRIWRCKALGNSLGADFYLNISWATAGTGNPLLRLGEEIDPVLANHRWRRYAQPIGGVVPAADFTRTGDTYATYANGDSRSVTTNTTGFDWQILVSNSFFALSTTVAAAHLYTYIGASESALDPILDPMPLVGLGLPSTGDGAWTRHPNRTASDTNNWRCNLVHASTVRAAAAAPRVDDVDAFRPAAPLHARAALCSFNAAFGHLRGWLFDSYFTSSADPGRNGDFLTIDGVDYYCFANTGFPASHLWIAGNASS